MFSMPVFSVVYVTADPITWSTCLNRLMGLSLWPLHCMWRITMGNSVSLKQRVPFYMEPKKTYSRTSGSRMELL